MTQTKRELFLGYEMKTGADEREHLRECHNQRFQTRGT